MRDSPRVPRECDEDRLYRLSNGVIDGVAMSGAGEAGIIRGCRKYIRKKGRGRSGMEDRGRFGNISCHDRFM